MEKLFSFPLPFNFEYGVQTFVKESLFQTRKKSGANFKRLKFIILQTFSWTLKRISRLDKCT